MIKAAAAFRIRGYFNNAIIVSKFPLTPTIMIIVVIHPATNCQILKERERKKYRNKEKN